MATATTIPDAPATEIGVTAAVRPSVHGTPPDQETRILSVGTDLFADERVVTSKRGQTHLLFVDGSTLSMGPGAELTLDHFVYDHERKVGELVVSASKGLLRFVGGRISKKTPVIVNTPTSVIGIRGGIAMIQVGDAETPSSVTMLFGQEAFMERDGRRQTITRPGFRVSEADDGGIEQPQPVTQQELTEQLRSLEEPPVELDESPEALAQIAPAAGGPSVSDEDVANTQMAELGSDNDPAGQAPESDAQQGAETSSSETGGESSTETVTAAQQTAAMASQQPVSDTIDQDTRVNQISESVEDFTATGIRAKATDLNVADTITYSLDDSAGGRFSIDPSTGVVSVANSALLDAEAAQNHTVTVRAMSSDGSFTTASFTITIADDASEFSATAATDGNPAANAVNEGAADGAIVGIMAMADDADISDTVTFNLDDSAGGRFVIDPQTGVVRVADSSLLDAESAQSHTVIVRTTSTDSSSATALFTVAIGDDNSEFAITPIGDSNAAANQISETTTAGAIVGVTGSASDGDVSDTVTFSLDDSAGGRFAIDPVTGIISVADSALLDAESAQSHTVTVRASSTDGSFATAVFTIAIDDDNSEFSITPVSDGNAAANQISETTAAGAVVGLTGSASDGDEIDTVSYSLDGDAGGRFSIDPSTGVVSVANSALLDAESAQNHTITVRATSTDGSATTATFTIAINDDRTEFSATAPTDSNAAANAVAHGAAAGIAANLTAFSSDGDISDTVTYSLTDNAGGRFQIDGSSGAVTTAATDTSFKSSRRHAVTVQASSLDGSTADASFSIEVLYSNFEGRLKRDANAAIDGTDDSDPINNSTLSNVVLGFGNLDASVTGGSQSLTLPFPDLPGPISFTSADNWPFGGLAGTSQGFLNGQQTFVYYEVIDAASTRSLVFAGDPSTSSPGNGITAFDLTTDFVRDQDLPFVSGFPISGLAEHGRLYVAWGNIAPGSQKALGGGIVYVTGAGASQKSGAFFITGRVLIDPSARQHVSASLFGMTRADSSMQPSFYSGGLASSDAGDSSDFFGSGGPDAFVLESATVNSVDVVQSIGLNRSFQEADSTYNANSVALWDIPADFNEPRTSQTLNGFVAGNQQNIDGGTTVNVGFVTALNGDADNVVITTDAALNTISASFTLEDFDSRTIVYNFGSATADGTGAFIEDGRFYAQGSTATVNGSAVTSVQGLATSDIAVFDGGAIPANFDLCNCDYLTWGFWGAMREFTSGSPNTALTHLGSWVAGELASNAEVTSSNIAGAVYSGNAIGDVRNGSDRYVATGTIDLTFNFSPGSYTLEAVTLNNFDGLTYTSSGGGGQVFSDNHYTSSEAELMITSGSNTLTIEGAFFAGQTAPSVPLATAGQGTILSGSPQYFVNLTYGAALEP